MPLFEQADLYIRMMYYIYQLSPQSDIFCDGIQLADVRRRLDLRKIGAPVSWSTIV